eukprot:SAG31_NODE_416_length_15934_cov_7.384970_14_plen_69_part_00
MVPGNYDAIIMCYTLETARATVEVHSRNYSIYGARARNCQGTQSYTLYRGTTAVPTSNLSTCRYMRTR